MTRIFCYGDSNTYGYDACSMLGERLPKEQRWTDILQKYSGWEMINEGMNGRMIPREAWAFRYFDQQLAKWGNVDLILIMLGTNDLLNSFEPDMGEIGKRMACFIGQVLQHPVAAGRGEKLLLVAPPVTDVGRYRKEDACYDRESEKFGVCYKKIAGQYGLGFADAARWELPMAHDGVHMAPEGHVLFAKNLWIFLKEFLK